jgi:competence protein ComEA
MSDDIIVQPAWRAGLEALVGSKRQLMTLAAFLVAALVTGIVLLGGRAPARIAPPARAPVLPTDPVPSPTASPTVFVHVSGAVRSPGLYEMPAGSRVADAVDAAGGARGGADLDALNLAEVLTDGTKVHVPAEGEPATVVSPVAGASPSPAIVNVNSADTVALESIPGIGPTRAAAIIAYREEVGGFVSVDQLLEVPGIGPATLGSIRSYVTV